MTTAKNNDTGCSRRLLAKAIIPGFAKRNPYSSMTILPNILTSLVLAATLLLAGCGQMGPLYEPEDTPPPAPPSAPAA